MKQLFDGTPVAIASEPDGSMRVDVPMTFSFDDKSNAPKPPLRAVMDKVAVSMARQATTKVQLASPGPVARGAAMRSYLQGRGVIGLRVVVLAPTQGDAVTLRVVPGPGGDRQARRQEPATADQRLPRQSRRSGQAGAVIAAIRRLRATA